MKFLAADYQDPDELEMAAKRKKLVEEQRRMAMQLRQKKESICEEIELKTERKKKISYIVPQTRKTIFTDKAGK